MNLKSPKILLKLSWSINLTYAPASLETLLSAIVKGNKKYWYKKSIKLVLDRSR